VRPVVPIHVAGPSSTLFHLFDRVSQELRDITLFHELLNKQGDKFHLTFGRQIPWEQLAGDPQAVTDHVRNYVENILPNDPERPFEPLNTAG
jgi:putative hemolysin